MDANGIEHESLLTKIPTDIRICVGGGGYEREDVIKKKRKLHYPCICCATYSQVYLHYSKLYSKQIENIFTIV